MARMRPRLQRADAGRGRRGVRLPRRPRPPGAAWMGRHGLEWAYRLAREPRRLWRRYARYNPRFVAAFARQYAAERRRTARVTPEHHDRCTMRRRRPRSGSPQAEEPPERMSYDVAIVGLGRVGLPLALAFADRGLACIGHRQRPRRAWPRCGRARCRSASRAPRSCSTASRSALLRARSPTPPRADHIVITLGTPSFSHIEIDMQPDPRGVDALRGGLRAGHSLILRSTVAPGTTDFVAGYLRRQHRARRRRATSTSRTRPSGSPPAASSRRSARCRASSAASARRAARSPASLFSVFGAPIVQTTPVQAELAKIWTNILRYSTFALPNLLMMDCEQYGANVFEVIDLINRDYPRGGIAHARHHRRHLPAQGLRVLRGALERAGHAARRLARQRVGAAVPGPRARAPASGSLEGRRVAVLGLAFKADTDDERDSLSHKLIRLLERELADVAVHDPLVRDARRRRFEDALAGRRRRDRRHQPQRLPHARGARARSPRGRRRLPGRRPLELLGRRRSCSRTPRELLAPRAAPARMSRVLVTGGAGMIGQAIVRAPAARPRLRGPRLRPARRARAGSARRAEVHTGDLRERARRARRSRARRTSSTARRSSAGSPTSTASPTR